MGDPLLPHSQAWQLQRAPKPHKRESAPTLPLWAWAGEIKCTGPGHPTSHPAGSLDPLC